MKLVEIPLKECYYYDGPIMGICYTKEHGKKVFSIPPNKNIPKFSMYFIYDIDKLPISCAFNMNELENVTVIECLMAKDIEIKYV